MTKTTRFLIRDREGKKIGEQEVDPSMAPHLVNGQTATRIEPEAAAPRAKATREAAKAPPEPEAPKRRGRPKAAPVADAPAADSEEAAPFGEAAPAEDTAAG